MEPWSFFGRATVADSNNFLWGTASAFKSRTRSKEEKSDPDPHQNYEKKPDPDPHRRKMSGPGPHHRESRTRIRSTGSQGKCG